MLASMLEKRPKKTYLGLKLFITFEFGAFLGTYLLFQYMRSCDSCRYYMHKNFPFVLNGFYKFEEVIYKDTSKLSDIVLWKEQQNEN